MFSRQEVLTFWWGPFSNWFKRDFEVEGLVFNCNEQWMMYSKAMLFGDSDCAARILGTDDPKRQKALGREVKGYVDGIWQTANEHFVFVGALAKFSQHQDLYNVMMESGTRYLIEASPFDTIWGVGLAATDDRILDRTKWRGLNKQGNVLMRVRTVLQAARAREQSINQGQQHALL